MKEDPNMTNFEKLSAFRLSAGAHNIAPHGMLTLVAVTAPIGCTMMATMTL